MALWQIHATIVRAQIATSEGESDEAVRLGRQAAANAYVPVLRGWTLPALIEAELAAGHSADAGSHIDDLVGLCQAADHRYWLAGALMLKAHLARLNADLTSADTIGHQALNAALDVFALARAVDVIELLAGVAADFQEPSKAARLFGAAAALREQDWLPAQRLPARR